MIPVSGGQRLPKKRVAMFLGDPRLEKLETRFREERVREGARQEELRDDVVFVGQG